MTNEKYKKESYKTPELNLKSAFWANNIGTVLINQYKSYMIGKIADFGCNNGNWIGRVSLYDTVDQIVGFDINPEAIEQAVAELLPQIPTVKHKISFKTTNLTNIDFEENFFDFAYSFHTLEHIYPDDIAEVFVQIHKVLKPNAFFLVNMPDKESYLWEPTHVWHPSIDDLNLLVQNHGFDVVESYRDERGGQIGKSANITALYKKQ